MSVATFVEPNNSGHQLCQDEVWDAQTSTKRKCTTVIVGVIFLSKQYGGFHKWLMNGEVVVDSGQYGCIQFHLEVSINGGTPKNDGI